MSAIASPTAHRPGRHRLVGTRLRDVLIVLAALAIQVGLTHAAARHQPDRAALDVWGYALLVVGPAVLYYRRRRPIGVLAFVFAVTLAYWLLGYPHGPSFAALFVAFVTVAIRGHREIAWGTLAVGYACFLGLGALVGVDELRLGDTIGLAAWLLVLGAATELVRARNERAAEARRTRRQETLRRVGEERLRIARELHDVLAHNVSLINVQAGVALHLLQKGDAEAAEVEPALAAIKGASAETLREMRAVLGTLRQADEAAPRAPEPGLGDLEALVGRMRDAGVEVRLTFSGERKLPGSVDLAAYRIAQEALTNVARHAPGRPAHAEVSFDADGLTVAVTNPTGSGAAGEPEAGNGIVGMRERATALGGTLEARRDGAGVFTVRARLPVATGQPDGNPDPTAEADPSTGAEGSTKADR